MKNKNFQIESTREGTGYPKKSYYYWKNWLHQFELERCPHERLYTRKYSEIELGFRL